MHYHLVAVLLLLSTILLGGLATPSGLSPRWDDMRLKHSWNAIPENWECLGLPPAGSLIDLHVALKPHRKNALIDVLNVVSDPEHPKYGAHLSKEQVAELVAPHPDNLELVHSWLKYHGVLLSSVSVTHGGSSLTLTGVSVSQANDLLGASYQLYVHTKTNETIVRTVGYSLPAVLHGHVQTVAPTTYFFSPLTQSQTPRKRPGGAATGPVKTASGEPVTLPSSRDNVACTLSFMRWLYSTFAYVPTAMHLNALGIAGFGGDEASADDLITFMNAYRADWTQPRLSVTFVNLNGAVYDPNRPGVTADIGVQVAEGMAYPTPLIFYGTGATPMSDPQLAWLDYVFTRQSIPQTIGITFGNYELLFPRDYAEYVCSLFAQLGVLGVSVLFVSGSNGVGGGECNTGGAPQFSPIFPATCPWVTAIGGTTGYEPEIGASISGGGFSNYFVRPSYQQMVVNTFLNDIGNQNQGLYNPLGRGIPDIAAQALQAPFFHDLTIWTFDGTGASMPIVAGIISLLNDHQLSEGKSPLGFLNPWLYGQGRQGLNDIKFGSNPGCGTVGFSAGDGWDPVTGLGTPDFEGLLYILDLASPPNPVN